MKDTPQRGDGPESRDTILRVEKNRNFTILGLWAVAKDVRLSYKAKGLHTYLMSRPPGWTFNLRDLMNRTSDGRDAVKSALRELEETGYLRRERIRDDDGTFRGQAWTVSEVPKASWASRGKDLIQERKIRRWLSGDGKSGDGESTTNKNESVSSYDGITGIEKLRDLLKSNSRKRPPPLGDDEHRCPGCDWHAVHDDSDVDLCSDCTSKAVSNGQRPNREQQQRKSGGPAPLRPVASECPDCGGTLMRSGFCVECGEQKAA